MKDIVAMAYPVEADAMRGGQWSLGHGVVALEQCCGTALAAHPPLCLR